MDESRGTSRVRAGAVERGWQGEFAGLGEMPDLVRRYHTVQTCSVGKHWVDDFCARIHGGSARWFGVEVANFMLSSKEREKHALLLIGKE